ncbi:MAG: hypothetical protein IJP34_02430 [Clostridia bacterium]|nr:hypothetical protein [Clostridia bacterium]
MKFLKDFSLKKLFYNKQFAITFSVLMAFLLWLTIVINQKPIVKRTFTNIPVNINLENTFVSENNMNIIGDISKQRFTVTLSGPTAVISSLKDSDISIFASAGEVDAPGEYDLKVAATSTVNATEYDVISISPATVKINFDYIDTKEYQIEASAEGAVAAGGLIAENGIVGGTDGGMITITGPRTIMNRIETVKASAVVNKTLSQTESFDADIVLYDAENRAISTENLTLSVNKVKVTVPISKKKTVPVKVKFGNTPANFDASSIKTTLNHQKVTIIGTPEMIEKTTSVELAPIDITTVSSNKTKFEVAANLPEGVRLLDSIESFEVSVDTGNYITRIFSVSEIKLKNTPSGLKPTVPNTIANVKVFGPRSAVRNLSASDIYAQIDLKDKSAGVYTVDAVINFKSSKNVWAIGTYTTTVTLK